MEVLTREEIVVGTNEEFLLGYRVQKDEDEKIHLNQSFTNHSHIGRLKKVAISGRVLVSSGTDEYLRLFDLNRRKEMGDILPHSGTITILKFFQDKYMFAGSDDGKIMIYEKDTWKLLSKLKGHTGPVMDIAVHPSGKMAVSVGRNKQMITWNLITGKMSCKMSLKRVPDLIVWSLDGKHYVIVSNQILEIFSTETGRIIHAADFQDQIHTLIFVTEDVMAIGTEGRGITLYSVSEKTDLLQWVAHENRVKQIQIYSKQDTNVILVSVSSDGYIKMWSISTSEFSRDPELLAEISTTFRITCLAVRPDVRRIEKKKKKEEPKPEPVEVKQEVVTSDDEDVEIITNKPSQTMRNKRPHSEDAKKIVRGILKKRKISKVDENVPETNKVKQESKKIKFTKNKAAISNNINGKNSEPPVQKKSVNFKKKGIDNKKNKISRNKKKLE